LCLGSRRRRGCGLLLGLNSLLRLDYLPLQVEDLVYLGPQLLHVELLLPELLQQAFSQLGHHLSALLAHGAYLTLLFGAIKSLVDLGAQARGLLFNFVDETHSLTSLWTKCLRSPAF